MAAIAILTGTLVWLTFSLKSDQGQLSRQLEAIAADAVAKALQDLINEEETSSEAPAPTAAPTSEVTPENSEEE